MDCLEFEELSGAFALDAITPAEHSAGETHLAQCAACRELLRELQAAAALLPLSIEQMAPPETLKARLFATIRQDNVSARQPTTKKRSWSTQLLAVAALMLLVLLGGAGVWNSSLIRENALLHEQAASPAQHMTTSLLAITYPLKGDAPANRATGSVIYLPHQHLTIVIMRGLPRLQGTHVYQGWLLRDNHPASIGLLTLQNGIASVNFPGDITGYDTAAVSMEPGPTASKNAPSGPVVAVGTLK